jgi:hypothetical protein
MLTLHARATRPLVSGGNDAALPPLTQEQQARMDSRRTWALRKARAARVLLAADLADEAITALREAALAHAQAAGIARHRSEPATIAETLRPPDNAVWLAEIQSALQALEAGAISAEAAIGLAEWLLRA